MAGLGACLDLEPGDSTMFRHSIANQVAWGLHWLRTAHDLPDHAGACHWNAFMNAMHIMALEAAA